MSSSQYRCTGIQVDSGQSRLQERVEVLESGLEDLAAQNEQIGEPDLAGVEAARRERLGFVETWNGLRFERPNRRDSPLVGVE